MGSWLLKAGWGDTHVAPGDLAERPIVGQLASKSWIGRYSVEPQDLAETIY